MRVRTCGFCACATAKHRSKSPAQTLVRDCIVEVAVFFQFSGRYFNYATHATVGFFFFFKATRYFGPAETKIFQRRFIVWKKKKINRLGPYAM